MRALYGFIASVALVLAAAAAGFWAGGARCHAKAEAKVQAQGVAQVAEVKTEVARGKAAAATHIQSDRDLQARYDALEVQFNDLLKHSPLVAAPTASAPGADPVLTVGAVRLWDAALLGTPEPGPLPGGACGTDATPESACDALSPYTLADVWKNHASNARACATDRLRFNQLIDFLEGKTP